MIWPARICAVEITDTEVKAAVVRQQGNTAKVLTLARQSIEQTEDEDRREYAIRALERMMDETDLSADVYTGCLPGTAAVVRPLEIPFTGRSRIAAAVKYEMEPVVPFQIEDLIVDYIPIRRRGKTSTDVLAVGLRAETVRFHLEVLEGAGLNPDRLDLDISGLTNLWRRVAGGGDRYGDKPLLMMHIREECTFFVALDGHVPVFMRAMNFGAEAIRTGAVLAVEEVVATVRSAVASADERGFTELVVTGIDLDERVRTDLVDRLGMSVRCAVPGDGLPVPSWPEHALESGPNCWEAVAGLAADGGQRDWMRFNFRKEDLAPTFVTPEVRRRAIFSGGLVGVLVLVGILSFFRGLQGLRMEADRLDEAITHIYKTTLPDAPSLPVEKIHSKMNELVEEMTTDRMVQPFIAGTPTALEVLDSLSACIPQDDSVEITQLQLKAGTVRLSGMTDEPAVVSQIKLSMDELDCLDNVTIERQQDTRRDEKKVDFSIVGTVKNKTS